MLCIVEYELDTCTVHWTQKLTNSQNSNSKNWFHFNQLGKLWAQVGPAKTSMTGSCKTLRKLHIFLYPWPLIGQGFHLPTSWSAPLPLSSLCPLSSYSKKYSKCEHYVVHWDGYRIRYSLQYGYASFVANGPINGNKIGGQFEHLVLQNFISWSNGLTISKKEGLKLKFGLFRNPEPYQR